MIPQQYASGPAAGEAHDAYEAVAGMYDLFAAAQGSAALPRVSAFVELAKPGMRVADVGAGTGRVALAVAGRGAQVWCVEPSASMRSALLAKLAGRPALWPHVTVVPGRAPGLGLEGRFDYAYLAGSLQFLDAADRLATFTELHAHLRDGAVLAMDMVGGSPALPPTGSEVPVAEAVVGGTRYLMTAAVVAARADQALVRYTYIAERGAGRTVRTLERRRFFHDLAAVRADLVAAGFAVDADAGDDWPDSTRPITARRNP